MTPEAIADASSDVAFANTLLPAGLVIERNSVVGARTSAQSKDPLVVQGGWSEHCRKFRRSSTWNEFVMVLEGGAIITSDGCKLLTLSAGDFGYLRSGQKLGSNIPRNFRKTLVRRTPELLTN